MGGLAASDPSALVADDAADGVAAEAELDDPKGAPDPPRKRKTRCNVLSFWIL